MKNKEQLIEDIGKLPQFRKRDIYTKDESDFDLTNGDMPYIQEIRLIGMTETTNNKLITTVSKGYKVVQFNEVFEPIINYFPSVNGELRYYWGSSVLKLFPDGEEFKTDDGKRIGLIISNSVNKMLAINLNFSVLLNGNYIVLPNLSGFRQLHLGNVKEV